jgi:hypothetical protein
MEGNKNRRFAQYDYTYHTSSVAGLAMWAISTYWYRKRFYLKDKNLVGLITFSLVSLYASHLYGRAFFESVYTNAAMINNYEEEKH